MTIHARKSPLIVHQEHPFNAEPPGDLLRQSFLTPQQHFYVRTHGSIPAVDSTSYRLLLTGLVQRKRELSLDELRSLSPAHTVMATLECAGNRRHELMAVKPIPEKFPGEPTSSGRQHGEAFPYERCCEPSEWRQMPATSPLPVSMRRNLRGKR